MTGLKNLILAMTVLGASTAAHAADDNFASRVFGQTSDKDKKSHALNSSHIDVGGGDESAWGARLGQQNSQSGYNAGYANVSVSHNGIKLRQEDLMGRYDLSSPAGVSKQS